jgi:hypothetical protein
MLPDEVMEGSRLPPSNDTWKATRRIVDLQPYTFPLLDVRRPTGIQIWNINSYHSTIVDITLRDL